MNLIDSKLSLCPKREEVAPKNKYLSGKAMPHLFHFTRDYFWNAV